MPQLNFRHIYLLVWQQGLNLLIVIGCNTTLQYWASNQQDFEMNSPLNHWAISLQPWLFTRSVNVPNLLISSFPLRAITLNIVLWTTIIIEKPPNKYHLPMAGIDLTKEIKHINCQTAWWPSKFSNRILKPAREET